MGFLDVLNGMQHGPRGPSNPSAQSGGMSPLTMAILGLLAYKALKHFSNNPASPSPASPSPAGPSPAGPSPAPAPGTGGATTGGMGGGLGDLLKGGLGGLLAGGAAGSVISGGLGVLLEQLQQNGHGETASSWVGNGPNKAISANDLASALGADQIENLSKQSGLSRDELLSGLAKYLPEVVNHLTPDGRLPTEGELSGRL